MKIVRQFELKHLNSVILLKALYLHELPRWAGVQPFRRYLMWFLFLHRSSKWYLNGMYESYRPSRLLLRPLLGVEKSNCLRSLCLLVWDMLFKYFFNTISFRIFQFYTPVVAVNLREAQLFLMSRIQLHLLKQVRIQFEKWHQF